MKRLPVMGLIQENQQNSYLKGFFPVISLKSMLGLWVSFVALPGHILTQNLA